MRRSLLITAVTAALLAAADGEQPAPMSTLPPEPRTLQLNPGRSEPVRTPGKTTPQLSAEVQAMRHAIERVRQSLAAGAPSGAEPGDAAEAGRQGRTPPPAAAEGAVRHGKLFGEALSVQPVSGGGFLVTASVGPQPANEIFTELAKLIGAGLDENPPTALTRRVELRVSALPLPDTLDRLLGQVGLRWREEGSGKARRIIVETTAATADDRERRSRRALERVAAGPRSLAGIEAMWLLAAQDLAARRNAAALKGFSEIIDAYGANPDLTVNRWVQLATRGSGEAMLALGAWADARIAFRAWLARAEQSDAEGARVLLLTAEAARRSAAERADPGAFDEAVDDLHRLLERYGNDPRAATEVATARFAIGELLFTSGMQMLNLPGAAGPEIPATTQQRFREAETQILRWLRASGKTPETTTDQIAFWLAECAFYLGRSDEARPRYELIQRRWKSGHTDPQAKAEIYPQAAFRVGECWLRRSPPDPVRALFTFLRARQDFPGGDIEPYLLVRISQCYAELEAEDQAVATLYDLLRNDQANDARPGRQQLDQLLGELVGRLGAQPGPVRARVLFYVARAQWLHARRDRTDQTASARQAAATYRRVLDEDPPAELRQATMLGMARSYLLAGDDAKGETELRRFLRDPTVSPRDREYAAQLLGEHLRGKGRLKEAIQAFRGEVPE